MGRRRGRGRWKIGRREDGWGKGGVSSGVRGCLLEISQGMGFNVLGGKILSLAFSPRLLLVFSPSLSLLFSNFLSSYLMKSHSPDLLERTLILVHLLDEVVKEVMGHCCYKRKSLGVLKPLSASFNSSSFPSLLS